MSTGATSSRLEWVEDIRVPGVPQFLAGLVAKAAAKGFQTSITRLAKRIAVT